MSARTYFRLSASEVQVQEELSSNSPRASKAALRVMPPLVMPQAFGSAICDYLMPLSHSALCWRRWFILVRRSILSHIFECNSVRAQSFDCSKSACLRRSLAAERDPTNAALRAQVRLAACRPQGPRQVRIPAMRWAPAVPRDQSN